MSITLKPETEALLNERARAESLSLDAYLDRLMQDEDAIIHHEELLREAMESGEHIELNDEEWNRIEQDAFSEVQARARQSA